MRGCKRRMTKVKLTEATKEINQQAGVILEEAARIRRNIENVLQTLRKQEAKFQREEEEERARKRQEEQHLLAQQHTKAWTMPDEEEAEAKAPAAPALEEKKEEPAKKAEKPAVKKEEAPKAEKAQEAEKPAAKKEEAPKAERNAEEKKHAAKKEEAPKAEKPVEEKPAPKKEEAPKAEKPVEEKPAPKKEEAPKAEKPVEEKPTPKKEEAPKTEKPAEAPKAAAPAAAPQQQPRPAAAPQQQRPAPGTNRPQGPYGRPANPQQGQGGPYGRPANSQGPYGRPANPQQGQGGPYGRPANPQGPYGRPANPQQGQGGPYGRPANAGQQPYGRPAAPGGQYGRPAGGPGGAPGGNRPPMGGGAPRPQGGGNRPMGGGMGRRSAPELTPVVEKERVSNYDPNKKQYIRQHDPEHVAKNRKQLVKESFNGYDDETVRGGKRARASKKQPSVQQMMAPIKIEKAYMTAETITVKDLTERIGKPAGEILKKLLMLGIMSNINSELDFDTASLVCSEFEVELEMKLDKTAEDALSEANVEDAEEDLQPRPPVITIMGHVDHGKTSLLDYIRKAHVTTTEAGGITQHIGAYTVKLDGRQITFLDTPGHEAFTAMRMRGTQATDIAVLVVAADDGVMPQTIESINHAKAAGVPIVVAINKMDKPTANPDRIMQDLTKYDLVPEDWGGETIMVPVSALTGDGVEDLLEMILLQADVLQLRANPNRMATGVIIEAKLDKARGPLATVLLQNGTLKVGDNIVAGMASGRVRAMLNDRGERVQTAGPSTPVEIAGFTDVPLAGDEMLAVADDHLSRQVAQERRDKEKAARVNASAKVSLDNLFAGIAEGKVQNLNIIVKADVQGSVEAVKQALEKLSTDEVKIRILHSAVGAVTKDDVNLASAFNAIIIGFNIRPDATAREAAEKEEVDIRLYRIIYQAIEDVEKAMKGLLAPEFKENLLGHAQVRNVFKITGSGTIAGSYVTDGKVQRNASVRLLRDNVVVFEGKLSSLRRFKDDVKEVASGYECGIGLENYNDVKEGDVVECFVMEEIER
ncbi:MAG: translation initiation factor IF-2 [Clostridiales bacterium]|nr:translation initiation factor IF-2 [Clostridiales bacterium]